MAIGIAACTHRGAAPIQQDALLIDGTVLQGDNLRPPLVSVAVAVLVAIAAGVAVTPNAQLASHFVLKTLAGVLVQRPQDCRDGLLSDQHVRIVQTRLCGALARRRETLGAATTLLAVQVQGREAVVLRVGDCRAELRSPSGAVRQLCVDPLPGQAAGAALVADPAESGFAIHGERLLLAPGELLALCSDGVHGVLGAERWQGLVAAHADPDALVTQTRAAVIKAGAQDNFSLLVLAAVAG